MAINAQGIVVSVPADDLRRKGRLMSRMCYWNEENFFEPGEFDEKIEELKNELRESVKKKSMMESRNSAKKIRSCRALRETSSQ